MSENLRARQLDASFWAGLDSPESQEHFLASWLSILCRQIEGVTAGLLLIASGQERTFVPAAVWPPGNHDLMHLGEAAQKSLMERRGVILPSDPAASSSIDKRLFVAYPIEINGALKGAVVVDAPALKDDQLEHIFRLIHWGNAWLFNLFERDARHEQEENSERLGLVNSLLASVLQERGLKSCLMVIVNELALKLSCDRVSLGLVSDAGLEIEAISNTASFDKRSQLSRAIEDAMDEVLDAGCALRYPAPDEEMLISTAQADLSKESEASGVLSVPLSDEGFDVGVLVLEKGKGETFGVSDVNICNALGMLLGPVLVLKREREKSLFSKAWQSMRSGAIELYSEGGRGVRLVFAVVVCTLILLVGMKGEYRVSARTVVEGVVQRATAAPFDGFIAESLVQAGDVVRKGQLMAKLDDHDLQVELAKWTSEREQYLRKYRQAMANHDRAAVGILAAQAEQSAAQVQLIQDKLNRTQLLAPFDGIVVSGDLRQLIGTPVETGKVLFETAPLNAFRVILQVDEREISYLTPGQKGGLVLSSIPGELFNFSITQVNPVAVAQDGKNFFRVEAHIDGGVERVRPGMEGIGKVSVGRYRWIWIWTHSLTDWLTIAAWRWTL